MNLDHDDECTCDVGPFATCPACERARAQSIKSERELAEDERVREYWRKKKAREDAAKLSPMDIWNYARMK